MANLRFLLTSRVVLPCALAACGFDVAPHPANLNLPPMAQAPVAGRPAKAPKPPAPTAPDEEDVDVEADPPAEPAEADPPAESPMLQQGGKAEPCPSCDDKDPCTKDARAKNASACECTHVPVPARDDDGCCAPGAKHEDDLDCADPVSCGNGVVDKGEDCDGGGRCTLDCKFLFAPSLTHRYSFDGMGEEVVDSIGKQNGKVMGASLSGMGDVVLGGAPQNAYVALPGKLVSGLTSLTIETWVTTVRGTPGQRILDFGNQNSVGDPTSYLALIPSSLIDGNAMALLNLSAQVDFSADDQYVSAREPIGPSRMHAAAIVLDGETHTMTLYIDGVSSGSRRFLGELSSLDDAHVWLGRPQFDEYPYLAGRIHEFRIYSAALTRAQIEASFAAGPDPGAVPAK